MLVPIQPIIQPLLPIQLPYDIIELIVTIAIEDNATITSTLTQVNSEWRHATLYHRFKRYNSQRSSEYFKWIKESGIQFDISIYVKEIEFHLNQNYTIPHFTTLNLELIHFDSKSKSSMQQIELNINYEKSFCDFIRAIKSVKDINCFGSIPIYTNFTSTALTSLNRIVFIDCVIQHSFWNRLCSEATNITGIRLRDISFSSEVGLCAMNLARLKDVNIGNEVPPFVTDLILGDYQYIDLVSFAWNANVNDSRHVLDKLCKYASLCYIEIETCTDYHTGNYQPNNSIDFHQILHLCERITNVNEIQLYTFTLNNFNAANLMLLMSAVKNKRDFMLKVSHYDYAMQRLFNELENDLDDEAYEKLNFIYSE